MRLSVPTPMRVTVCLLLVAFSGASGGYWSCKLSGYEGELYARHEPIAVCRNTSILLRYAAKIDRPGLVLNAGDGAHNQIRIIYLGGNATIISAHITLGGQRFEMATKLLNTAHFRLLFSDSGIEMEGEARKVVYIDRVSPVAAVAGKSEDVVVMEDVFLGGLPDTGAVEVVNFVGEIAMEIAGTCHNNYSVGSAQSMSNTYSESAEAEVGRDVYPHNDRQSSQQQPPTRCEIDNLRCLHDGVCVDNERQSAAQCDCRRTHFFGVRCQHPKVFDALELSGTSCLRLRLAGHDDVPLPVSPPHPISHVHSLFESIQVTFRTKQLNNVLFYVSGQAYHVAVTMAGGHLWLSTGFHGQTSNELLQFASYQTFNDLNWHQLKLTRDESRLTVYVDENLALRKALNFTLTALVSVWFGGAPEIDRRSSDSDCFYPRSTTFTGSLRDLLVTVTGTMPIDVASAFRDRHSAVALVSHCSLDITRSTTTSTVLETPAPVPVPISFARGHKGLVSRDLWSSVDPSGRSLSIDFRTAKMDGTVLIHVDYIDQAVLRLLAMELFAGELFVTVVTKGLSQSLSRERLRLEARSEYSAKLWISDRRVDLWTSFRSKTLELQPARFSGAAWPHSVTILGSGSRHVNVTLDPHVTTMLLLSSFSADRSSFRGCISSLRLDQVPVNLTSLAASVAMVSGYDNSFGNCVLSEPRKRVATIFRSGNTPVAAPPCRNGGGVIQLHDVLVCDCTVTDYDGDTCETLTPTLTLLGNGSLLKIDLPSLQQAEANEVTLRFRATETADSFGGVLLFTSSPDSNDHLCVFIDKNRRLRVRMDLGSTWLNFSDSAVTVSANQWHSVKVTRILISSGQHQVVIIYDGVKVFDYLLLGNSTSLEFLSVLLGSHRYNKAWSLPVILPPDLAELEPLPDFIGQLQHVSLNDRRFLKNIYDKKESEIRFSYELNADVGLANKALLYPLTVAVENVSISKAVSFTTLFNFSGSSFDTTLRFLLKTTLINALFVHAQCYTTGSRVTETVDVKVLLRSGKVTLSIDIDERYDSEPLVVTSHRGVVNDDKWHSVSVQLNSRFAAIVIDELPATSAVMPSEMVQGVFPHTNHYECALIVGGNTNEPLGFRGCMASFELNQLLVDLSSGEWSTKDMSVTSSLLPTRPFPPDYCTGRPNFDLCAASLCKNGGLRVPTLDTCRCDCSMTSFTGTSCSKYSTTFKFEPSEESHAARTSNAYIIYDYPPEERRDRRIDMISFGVSTLLADCFVLSLESTKKQKDEFSDYLELFLQDGYVNVRYNLGSGEKRLPSRKYIADGRYHVVRLLRNGSSATLQIDDGALQHGSTSVGKSHMYFNAENRVVIAKAAARQKRSRDMIDFVGLLSGLFINNIFVLDEVAGLRRSGANVTVGNNVTKVDVEAYFGDRNDDEGQADSPNNNSNNNNYNNNNNDGRSAPLLRTTPPIDTIIVAHRDCSQLQSSEVAASDCITQANAIVRPTGSRRRKTTTTSMSTTQPQMQTQTQMETPNGKQLSSDYAEEYEDSEQQPQATATNDFSTLEQGVDDEASEISISHSTSTQVSQNQQTQQSLSFSFASTRASGSDETRDGDSKLPIAIDDDIVIEVDSTADFVEKGEVGLGLSTPRSFSFASSLNMLLIVAVAAGCILVSAIASVVAYKCFKKKDTGTYKVDSAAAERIALRPANTTHVNRNGHLPQAQSQSQLQSQSRNGNCNSARLSATLPRPIMTSQPSSILKNGRVHSATIHHVLTRNGNGNSNGNDNGNGLNEQLLHQEWYV